MALFDATEILLPFRVARGHGAILFDGRRFRQADPQWLLPTYWQDRAQPVQSGGRGSAWFVDAPFGACVLRQYRRGGMAAQLSRDRYLWLGADLTRSFAEFRLTRVLLGKGLPVPAPIMAGYRRSGLSYRAALLVERLPATRSLAECIRAQGAEAPWEATGRLIARFHQAGLDHADLNADNLLFDAGGKGWLIDFDRGQLRIPATWWRERNLARLQRSVLKVRGTREPDEVRHGFARLRRAYHAFWERYT